MQYNGVDPGQGLMVFIFLCVVAMLGISIAQGCKEKVSLKAIIGALFGYDSKLSVREQCLAIVLIWAVIMLVVSWL